MDRSYTKSINYIRRIIKETVTNDDIVNSVLYRMKSCNIPDGSAVFHEIFYKLKKDKQFEELLKDFYFDENGLSPYSKELEQVLFRLMVSQILWRLNLTTYVKSKTFIFKESYNKFVPELQQIIDKMAKIADKMVEDKIKFKDNNLVIKRL